MNPNPYSKSILERAKRQTVADLYESAGRIGAFSHRFINLGGKKNLAGLAFPIVCPPGSNIWIHKAIYLAEPGDILTIATLGDRDTAYLGDLLVQAAIQQKLGGIVIEGRVRDIENLRKMPLPIFALGSAVIGPGKATSNGGFDKPVTIGGVKISKGDLVRGNLDGVVIIPKNKILETIRAAEIREKKEQQIRKQMAKGVRPLHDLLGLKLP